MKTTGCMRLLSIFILITALTSSGKIRAEEIRSTDAKDDGPIIVMPAREKSETPAPPEETKVPLLNPWKLAVQPLLGAAFVAPWIWYLNSSKYRKDTFLKKTGNVALYLGTPAAMSLTVVMTGWLLDSRSYSFFASFGIATGLNYLAPYAIYLLSVFYIASAGNSFNMRKYYIVVNSISAALMIVAVTGGDILGKLLTRKTTKAVQQALFSGDEEKISFGFPAPAAYERPLDSREKEIYFGTALLYYRF